MRRRVADGAGVRRGVADGAGVRRWVAGGLLCCLMMAGGWSRFNGECRLEFAPLAGRLVDPLPAESAHV